MNTEIFNLIKQQEMQTGIVQLLAKFALLKLKKLFQLEKLTLIKYIYQDVMFIELLKLKIQLNLSKEEWLIKLKKIR